MPDYRCYLLGLSGSILAAHEIACADDEAAIAKAHELFRPHAFEVWLRDRRIYPMARSPAIEADAAHDLQRSRHWRQKAEECRAIAQQMETPAAKLTFWRMAETYDRLAGELEGRARGASAKRTLTG